ncbi:hypothetical protein H1R20_g15779, partial [Candolleomyces eurysporus]
MASGSSSSSPSVARTTTDKSKVGGANKPNPYDGNPNTYRNFVTRFKIYSELKKDEFPEGEKKVLLFLSFLIDEAALWADNWIISKTGNDGKVTYGNFPEIFKEFETNYAPVDQRQNAEFELDSLKQGNMPANEFVTKFKRLAREANQLSKATATNQEADPADIALRAKFQKKLHPRLWKTILDEPRAQQPKTFEEWCKRVIEREGDWRNMIRATGGNVLRRQPRINNLRTSSPDEINAARLTQSQRDECRKKGLCYRCQKQGHLVKDCPLPAPNNSAGSSRPPPFKKKEDQKQKKKPTAKEVYRYIRNAPKNMEESEVKKLERYMEEGSSDEDNKDF